MEILKNSKKMILLGNEAIVRGALEAGVQFVSTYPGTPASEIGDIFAKIAKGQGIYFEFSTNEKVALEAGIGASFSGLKTLVAMKNFGLNVASDSLVPFLYTGSKGPTVIVVADDPSCHSSAQSEQNTRGFSYLAHLPTLEPSDPQECKDFTKLAFQISAKYNLPVMLRTTTRVAHQRGPVVLGRIVKSKTGGGFIKNKSRFVTMPPRLLEMHKELLGRVKYIRDFSEASEINRVERGELKSKTKNQKSKEKRGLGLGVIASGVSYFYAMEALQGLGLNLPVLKLGFFYPLPEEKIKSFIKKLKKVLIVEELEPYLEKEITALAKDANPKLQIFGKSLLPEVGELTPDLVMRALARVAGKPFNLPKEPPLKRIKHSPRFCTGWPTCPYWKVFAAVKQAAPKNTIFGGDIGCYMMAAFPPHNLYDYLFSMGSSIGIAHGIKKALQVGSRQAGEVTKPILVLPDGEAAAGKQKLIAFIGDSTFFHAGIPALINIVYNRSNPLIIILDNSATAMTGHQPHPGIGKTGMGEEGPGIKIENIVRALGIKNMQIIDPEKNYDIFVKTIKEFLSKEEPSVIIARRICGLLAKKQSK